MRKIKPIRSVLIHGIRSFEDETRAATAASHGAPSFRRTQAPFASTTTDCSCSPWFFVLLFPHDKNFAFIFDMQALVRLFLSCGSPCVRSTSDCAVWLRSRRTKRSGISRGIVPIYASADFPSCERCSTLQGNDASLSNRGMPEGKG